jgi:tRNA(fMet)-specific endonuclease VapC
MKPLYMLDTNICIYLIKRHPPEVAQRFEQHYVGEIVISAITLAELEYGVACSGLMEERNQEALNGLLEAVPVEDFGSAAARTYGPLRQAIKERRRNLLDHLIASHAISLGTTLVTNNEADFRQFAALRLENWVPTQKVL